MTKVLSLPLLALACLSVVLTEPTFAEAQERFDVQVERLAEDVYVARRTPSWRLWVQANVTIIVNEQDVVVVDGGGFSAHVENVIAEIQRITEKPVSVVVTTHWHQDHNLGVHLYREHYPDVRLVSHRNTRDTLAESNAETLPRVTSEAYEERLLERNRERLEDARMAGEHETVVSFYEDYVAGAREVARDMRRARSNLADETFDRRLVLHRGERTIEILHFGRANTAGDAIVWLPRERIVATGDVVVRPTPYGFGSYPRAWTETLHRILELPFDVLVPGHGEVLRDGRYVSALIELMESVAEQTCAAVAAGTDDVEALREVVDLSAFDERIAGADPLRLHLFDIWFKRPIVEAAFEEVTSAGPSAADGESGAVDACLDRELPEGRELRVEERALEEAYREVLRIDPEHLRAREMVPPEDVENPQTR